MMKKLATLILLSLSFMSQAQFSCGNIQVLGIYKNNVNTSELTILLTNKAMKDDGNDQVYTSFELITENFDTILNSDYIFQLPTESNDTIAYQIPLNEKYRTIYELPEFNCGKIITEHPFCEIPYCFEIIPYVDLPQTNLKDCSDFKIAGLHPTANGGNKNYSLLLTNTNADSLRSWDIGYTSFQFFDSNKEPLSLITWPSYLVPAASTDTIIVHMNFLEELNPNERIMLEMTNPNCQVNFNYLISSNIEIENIRIDLFPNPSRSFINIVSESQIDLIEVIDINGIILNRTMKPLLDISKLNAGLYFLRIITPKTTIVEQIIKN